MNSVEMQSSAGISFHIRIWQQQSKTVDRFKFYNASLVNKTNSLPLILQQHWITYGTFCMRKNDKKRKKWNILLFSLVHFYSKLYDMMRCAWFRWILQRVCDSFGLSSPLGFAFIICIIIISKCSWWIDSTANEFHLYFELRPMLTHHSWEH